MGWAMECFAHAGTPAVSQCAACQRGICRACAEPKPAVDMGWATNALRRFQLGDRARWLAGTDSVLFCRPDCDALLALRTSRSRLGRVWSGAVTFQLAGFACGVVLVLLVVATTLVIALLQKGR